ncbi:DUF1150 family protein [Acetobacter indonesiensis]|jgi:hypothetical protein|uniref:DUF1150 domain-containing protein n=1 Tax=Acetobacter indonesiensis TaxID=104101 RepID=A0A252AYR9_9PROT|nr:DUF1150 family protein [Acetobacter indonesiensis]MCG0993796.1 DUF1150 domain-containing protein [Acetobacter indonesiensis]MCI1437303.1 DUF1150 domain-containing protein [Acetobacter indonesiensis]MCI1545422.1 DUF1150 domain-containing protein [Acetobacter indonesiensis]MCI1764841.1 DUF1150 domain-containing protein [Acetobacter indonesiensis]MCP1231220.1 DUF1150 domain-containing protein [Acetobacter indonesiensis]
MRVTTQNGRVVLVPDQTEIPIDVHKLSENEFRSLGLANVAYIRPALTEEGDEGCAIHAADGSPLAVVEDWETAWGIILHHDMVPASLQ